MLDFKCFGKFFFSSADIWAVLILLRTEYCACGMFCHVTPILVRLHVSKVPLAQILVDYVFMLYVMSDR